MNAQSSPTSTSSKRPTGGRGGAAARIDIPDTLNSHHHHQHKRVRVSPPTPAEFPTIVIDTDIEDQRTNKADKADINDRAEKVKAAPIIGNTSNKFRNVSACNRCRLRKNRCDQRLPSCASCDKANVKCVGYDPITKREIPRSYVYYLESRVHYLETLLCDRNVPFAPADVLNLNSRRGSDLHQTHRTKTDEDQALTHYASHLQSWQEVMPKKMHQDESERIDKMVSNVRSIPVQGASDARYLGSTSGISFARVVFAAVKSSVSGNNSEKSGVRPSRPPPSSTAKGTGTSMRDSFFGLQTRPTIKQAAFPSQEVALRLVNFYFEHANPQVPILHRGEFMDMFALAYLDGDARVRSPRELYMLNIVFAIGAGIFLEDSASSSSSSKEKQRKRKTRKKTKKRKMKEAEDEEENKEEVGEAEEQEEEEEEEEKVEGDDEVKEEEKEQEEYDREKEDEEKEEGDGEEEIKKEGKNEGREEEQEEEKKKKKKKKKKKRQKDCSQKEDKPERNFCLDEQSQPEEYHASAIVHLESCLSSPATIGATDGFGGGLEELQAVLLLAGFALLRPVAPGLWYIIGVAVRLAVDLGLHYEDVKEMDIVHEEVRDLVSPTTRDSDGVRLAQERSSRERGRREWMRDFRRRLWWCTYSLDRLVSTCVGRPFGITDQVITTEFPSLLDDQYITPHGFREAPHDAPTYKHVSYQYFRLRLLQSEILQVLQYQQAQQARAGGANRQNPYMFTSLPSPFLAQHGSFRAWRIDIDRRLSEWKTSAPRASDTGVSFSVEFLDLNYWQCVIMLYRQSLSVPALFQGEFNTSDEVGSPSMLNVELREDEERVFLKVAEAGQRVLRLYRHLHRLHLVNYTYLATHHLFMAGISFLYAIWHSPAVRSRLTKDEVDFTILAATSVLGDLIEKCPPAETCRDAFNRMSKATVQMCLSTTGFGSSVSIPSLGLDSRSVLKVNSKQNSNPHRAHGNDCVNLSPGVKKVQNKVFDMSFINLLNSAPGIAKIQRRRKPFASTEIEAEPDDPPQLHPTTSSPFQKAHLISQVTSTTTTAATPSTSSNYTKLSPLSALHTENNSIMDPTLEVYSNPHQYPYSHPHLPPRLYSHPHTRSDSHYPPPPLPLPQQQKQQQQQQQCSYKFETFNPSNLGAGSNFMDLNFGYDLAGGFAGGSGSVMRTMDWIEMGIGSDVGVGDIGVGGGGAHNFGGGVSGLDAGNAAGSVPGPGSGASSVPIHGDLTGSAAGGMPDLFDGFFFGGSLGF